MSDLNDPIAIRGYRDFTFLGRGASSVVYRAFQVEFDRLVAVKVLMTDDPDDPAGRRFAREKAIIGRLGGHLHIVQVFEAAVTTDGRPYISMQLYDGSLADRLDTKGSLTVADAVSIMADIAGATQAAHDAGILHRDIKPQNILLSQRGPGLADFGIARAVANLNWSQTLRDLTPLHAAPETFLDERAPDARSDIWSLGSTLFTALAGRPPFFVASSEPISKYQLRLERESVPHIPRNDISPALSEIINRALAKDPDRRFAVARDMEHALRAILVEPAPPTPTSVLALTVSPTTALRPHSPTPTPERHPADAASGASSLLDAPTPMSPTGPGSTSSTGPGTLLDPVVGDGGPTIVRRPRSEETAPSRPEPGGRGKRARWLLIGSGGVAVLVMFVLGALFFGGRGGGPSPITIPLTVPAAPLDTSHAPTDFTAVDHGDSVDLHWVDNSGGVASYVVIYRSVSGPQMSVQSSTPQAATIHGLDGRLGYCFRVVAIGTDKSGHHPPWGAADTAVRGCVATPASTIG